MVHSRRSLLKRAMAALLMAIPFRKRARAAGSGFSGRWQCGPVTLDIVESGGKLQATTECCGESSCHSGTLTSPTTAESAEGTMVLSGNTLVATYSTAEASETVTFYRIG